MTINNEDGSLIKDLCTLEARLEHTSNKFASNRCFNSDPYSLTCWLNLPTLTRRVILIRKLLFIYQSATYLHYVHDIGLFLAKNPLWAATRNAGKSHISG